jgi:hypothetical protein
LLQPLPGDRVDGAEGLVHEQDRRDPPQGPGHAHPLALAAGELVGEAPPVLVGIETDQVEQLVHPASTRPCPSRAGGERWPRCRHAPVGEEPALLDHVADARRSWTGSIFSTSVPSIRIRPPVGSMSRLIIRSVVVLPQPDGPDQDAELAVGHGEAQVRPRPPSRRRSAWSPVERDHPSKVTHRSIARYPVASGRATPPVTSADAARDQPVLPVELRHQPVEPDSGRSGPAHRAEPDRRGHRDRHLDPAGRAGVALPHRPDPGVRRGQRPLHHPLAGPLRHPRAHHRIRGLLQDGRDRPGGLHLLILIWNTVAGLDAVPADAREAATASATHRRPP